MAVYGACRDTILLRRIVFAGSANCVSDNACDGGAKKLKCLCGTVPVKSFEPNPGDFLGQKANGTIAILRQYESIIMRIGIGLKMASASSLPSAPFAQKIPSSWLRAPDFGLWPQFSSGFLGAVVELTNWINGGRVNGFTAENLVRGERSAPQCESRVYVARPIDTCSVGVEIVTSRGDS